MTPPSTRRPSQAETAIPEERDSEDTGVHGDLPDRIETRLRNANITLTGIRDDLTKHSATDEKSFGAVNGSVTRLEGSVVVLSGQHASMLGEIGAIKGSVGEIKGSVGTLLQLQQASTTAQLELAATTRADKSAERDANAKLAIAKTEASTKIWLKIIAAILVLAGITASAMVGHAVK